MDVHVPCMLLASSKELEASTVPRAESVVTIGDPSASKR